MTRSDTTNGPLSRRAVLGAGSATLAAIAMAPATASAANENVGTWALDPTGGGSACTSNCATCNACQHHRANKLFKTQAAAASAGFRAHPGCRCTVITGQSLSPAVFARVFQAADVADRRDVEVAELLRTETERRSVPMFSGVVPITILAAGAAGIGWLATRRRKSPDG